MRKLLQDSFLRVGMDHSVDFGFVGERDFCRGSNHSFLELRLCHVRTPKYTWL